MIVVLSKRHGAVAAQPGSELFVGTDETIGAYGENDGTQSVEDFVDAFGLGFDLRVETDKSFTEILFNEHIVDAARQGKRRDVMPACTAVVAPYRNIWRSVFTHLPCACRRRYAREQVDEVVFDGVLFVEHGFTL